MSRRKSNWQRQRDTLDGGSGHVVLCGQDANAQLLAKDGRTHTLDRGNGFDTAQRDKTTSITDRVLSIEAFI
jgi:hypothetical protein